ncbi:eCIS core domain-containing protein [Spirosoma panaciterrae]|uniref:eCIS core domain-containing protein n=1 Tax=Spirosoma panaciterrae TaxID=496058 RepID=UPI0003AA9CAD|nr:DUF4157 domain-containing protein [Spirosoma panaciterrae]
MADHVVQRLAQSPTPFAPAAPSANDASINTQPPLIQAKCADCEAEEKLHKKEEKKDEKPHLQTKPIFETGTPEDQLQRKCADCESEEQLLQREQTGSAEPTVSSSLESRLVASKGGGSALPEAARQQMERSMGADFSGVRVHTGSSAVQMSQELNAQAFTHGNDIYFNSGKYDLGSGCGQHLLAHELTHTVQQGKSVRRRLTEPVKPTVSSTNMRSTYSDTIQRSWLGDAADWVADKGSDAVSSVKDGAEWVGEQVGDGAAWVREQVKNGAGWVKDKAVEGFDWVVDRIKGLITSGKDWLNEKWIYIKEFATSGFDQIKSTVGEVATLITSPMSTLFNAFMTMDANLLGTIWNVLTGGATQVWQTVKAITDQVLNIGAGMWSTVSGFVSSLFDSVDSLINNRAFGFLPESLQNEARSLYNTIRSLWISIRTFWTDLWQRLTSFIRTILAAIENFVNQVLSYAIGRVINIVRTTKEFYTLLQQAIEDPRSVLMPVIEPIATTLDLEAPGKSKEVGQDKLQEANQKKVQPSSVNFIQRAPTSNPDNTRTVGTFDEIGRGLDKNITQLWRSLNIREMLWETLVNMFWPPATIRAIGHEFSELWTKEWANAADNLFMPRNIFDDTSGCLHDIWSNFLTLLDFPLALWRRLNNVAMLLMGYVTILLIILGAVGGSLAGTIIGGIISGLASVGIAAPAGAAAGAGAGGLAGAAAGLAAAGMIGKALLVSFLLAEGLTISKLILELFTARQTQKQKQQDYFQIASSLIAIGVVLVLELILWLISSAISALAGRIKGFFSTDPNIKADVEPKPTDPVEAKEGTSSEGKGAGEAPKLEGELGSRDGQRSIKVTERGEIWVCASPCERIRLKYEAQIKDNPALSDRIKAMEEGYSDLSPEQKSVRDTQIKQLEQELANAKLAQEGGVRPPKDIKWPPEPPQGNKPPINSPDAAEWRYQRYAYEKFQQGAGPKDILPPDEWMRRYFDPASEGGRPGRPGGPEQVAAKNELAREGIRIVENVELGGRYPDGIDPKLNPQGGRSYFEVGKMLESGIPEARERIKIADEIKAMENNDTVTFVDKTSPSKRITYTKGSTPENPTSRTF